MDTLTNEEIIAAAENLVETYNNDLDDQLGNELIQFKAFYHEFQKDDEENEKVISQLRWMYKLLLERNVKDCFPNIEVALRTVSYTHLDVYKRQAYTAEDVPATVTKRKCYNILFTGISVYRVNFF